MDERQSSSMPQQKYACMLCARRKIKCNKLQPCYNCSKSQADCQYQSPSPFVRPRKRGAENEPLARISEYEDLLRQHNIEFNSYAGDSTWIPWEGKSPSLGNVPVNSVPAKIEHAKSGECRPLWSSLNPELQNSSLHNHPWNLIPSHEPDNDAFSLIPVLPTPNVLELHPEPKHVFKLWQIFVENANPLIKIIHVPTLQQKIVETSWNLEANSNATNALLFAIYLLAVTSLSSLDCQTQFETDKATLLKRYRDGAVHSLMAAGLFSTRDLEVLQAFVLFLLAAPHSETATTLMAVAIRIAHKMGLHNENPSSKISFFEKEMRIRLWWQIQCLGARALQTSTGYIPLVQDIGNVRMPMNLNDSELHPNMVNSPSEHNGATEMIYCLMKYEGARWQQVARSAKKPPSNPTSTQPVGLKDQAIRDLERAFEEKYLRFCDVRIPLHFLALTMSRLAICRMRFMSYHPQGRPDGGAGMTSEERDILFEQSVRLLELQDESRKTTFTPQLLTHMARSQLDALIYMLFELKGRAKGERVDAAWNLVSKFYDQHREWMEEREDSFLDALCDLTLEAWQVRWKEVVEMQGGRGDDTIPWYIKELQTRRPKEILAASSSLEVNVATSESMGSMARPQPMEEFTGHFENGMDSDAQFLGMHFADDGMYNVEYWSEFLPM